MNYKHILLFMSAALVFSACTPSKTKKTPPAKAACCQPHPKALETVEAPEAQTQQATAETTENTAPKKACCLSLGEFNAPLHPKQVAALNLPKGVNILYFHNKKRCPTCISIEKNTKEVVDTHFGSAKDIHFHVFDISDSKNEAFINTFEVTFSSLILVVVDPSNEVQPYSQEDITKFAFANSRKEPEAFKARLLSELNTIR